LHFARRDLCSSCALKAELADAQAAFGPDRRTESAAGDRPGCVEIARSGAGIEGWARFGVGEVRELFLGGLVQKTRLRVAGEVWSKARNTFLRARVDTYGAFGIASFQIL